MNFFGLHLILDFIWAVFLLELITSLKYDLKEKYLFGILSVVSSIFAILVGIKLIVIYPEILKQGGWLHAKLTLLFLVFIENIYLLYLLLKKKKIKSLIYTIMFWFSFFVIVGAVFLSMFRPF